MGLRGPAGLSLTERADMWSRWKAGYHVREIARAFGRDHGSIHSLLLHQGGIAPRLRTRAAVALSLSEREGISRGIAAGESGRAIAERLGRAASTVCREIGRYGGRDAYRAGKADVGAWRAALRPKACLLALNRTVRNLVASKLALQWSPEQISGWLREEFPDDESMRVSHETIYRSLFIQARGVLKKELIAHLRSRRMMRCAKTSTARHGRSSIRDAVSISERPPEVEDRAVPGHWEGDLVSGSNNTHIATLVERSSRFLMLVKVKGKDTSAVVDAIVRQVKHLPSGVMTSLTWDRGAELAAHKRFSIATNAKVYFCDPSSPWQRGTNENTNGLLRQYFPRRTDLSGYTQRDLNRVAREMNMRPRKTLGYVTPAESLAAQIALTG